MEKSIIKLAGFIIDNDQKEYYSRFGIETTCPNEISSALETAAGGDVLLRINSPGGGICAGSEIFTALKNYKGKVDIEIVGLAGSCASFIAMARTCRMSPTAMMMIHNSSCCVDGDYRTFQKQAQVLVEVNDTIVNAYILKTGLDRDKLLTMMDDETWMSPQKALEYGFIDGILFYKQDTEDIDKDTKDTKQKLLELENSRFKL